MSRGDKTYHGIMWQLAASLCNGAGLYFIHFYVAKKLGVSEYALFGILIVLLMWVRVLIGSNNAMSKYLLDSRYCQRDVLKKTITLQFFVCILLFCVSQMLAAPLAYYLNEPRLEFYFRLLAMDFILSAGFTYLLRLQSTLRMFRVGAITNLVFMSTRIILIILAIRFGWGLTGVCFAYLVSPLLTTIFFLKSFGKLVLPIWNSPRTGENITYGELMKFSGFYIGFTVLYDMVIVLNLIITKSLIPDNELIGYYVAVGVICKMPRVILNHSVTAVMLTAVSEAVDAGKASLVWHYFKQLGKLVVGMILPYGLVVFFFGNLFLTIFYGSDYTVAAPLLKSYFFGFAGLSFIFVFSVFYVSENEPKVPFVFTLVMVILQAGLCYGLIPAYGLQGAAYSMLLTGLPAAVIFMTLLIIELRRKLKTVGA